MPQDLCHLVIITPQHMERISLTFYSIFNYYDYTCSDWGSFDTTTGKWKTNGNMYKSVSWCNSSVLDAAFGTWNEVYNVFGSALPSPAESLEVLNANTMPTLPVAAAATQSTITELWNPSLATPYKVLAKQPITTPGKTWKQGYAMTNLSNITSGFPVPTAPYTDGGSLQFNPADSACISLTEGNLASNQSKVNQCLFGDITTTSKLKFALSIKLVAQDLAKHMYCHSRYANARWHSGYSSGLC